MSAFIGTKNYELELDNMLSLTGQRCHTVGVVVGPDTQHCLYR